VELMSAGRGSRHCALARAAEGPERRKAEAPAARAARDREMLQGARYGMELWCVGYGGWSWAGLGRRKRARPKKNSDVSELFKPFQV
jgi:hypothetical protein